MAAGFVVSGTVFAYTTDEIQICCQGGKSWYSADFMPDEKRHPYPELCTGRKFLQYFLLEEQFGTIVVLYTYER